MSTPIPEQSAALQALLTDPVVSRLRNTFAAAGRQLYLVGGPVRDALRAVVDVADLDFTSDARPDELERILAPLGTLWTGGNPFGTIGVSVRAPGRDPMVVEVTTFRRDVYTADSRKPQVVFGDDIATDLGRRDLTVNAIALDVHTGALIDPFGGAAALAAGVLDTPDDPITTISEDPLRALRALRFAAKLDAALAPRLTAAIEACADRLRIVAVERRTAELRKLLAAGPGRASALRSAAELGVAPYLVGDLTVDDAALIALGQFDRIGDDEGLAVLAAATGPSAKAALRRLRLSGEEIADACGVESLVADLTAVAVSLATGTAGEPAARRLLRAHTDDALRRGLMVASALGRPVGPVVDLLSAVSVADQTVREPLPVNGDDLIASGLTGPAVGAALRRVELARHRGPLTRAAALRIAGV